MSFFDFITMKKPPRSTFNKSENLLTTLNLGDLVPCKFDFLLPGDRINLRTNFIGKFSPLVSPAFARMQVKIEWFFVPFSQLYAHYDDVLMNYKSESRTVVSDGVSESTNFVNLPYQNMQDFSALNVYAKVESSLNIDTSNEFSYNGYNTIASVLRRCKFLDYMGLPTPLTTSLLTQDSVGSVIVNPTYIHRFGNSLAQAYFNSAIADSGQIDDVFSWRDLANNYPDIANGLFIYRSKNLDLADYSNARVTTLFARAYQKIYSDWYRNQMLSDPIDIYFNTVTVDTIYQNDIANMPFQPISGVDYSDQFRYFNSLFTLRKRNYRKDYFNTASTDPTLGPDSVAIPQTVNDLRKANAIQRLLDKKAVSGPNFSDWLKYTWDVYADNYEVDRSVYLGGSTDNIKISEVLQTSETSSDSPLGTRAGEANSYSGSNGIHFVAPDYGVLVGIVSIRPEIDYYCGVDRLLQKTTWEDFPLPELSQIGMQQVLDNELKLGLTKAEAGYTSQTDTRSLWVPQTFGYVPRYQEFKTGKNRISGEFRDSLSFWHQSPNYYAGKDSSGAVGASVDTSRIYNNRFFSEIGQGFYVNSRASNYTDPYYNNIFSVTSDEIADHCQASINFDYTVNRALPVEDMPHL